MDNKLKNKGNDPYDGPDGFKNYGWPTMKLTFGALGTIVTGGATATYLGSSGVTTIGAIYSSSTLSLNAYSTIVYKYQIINLYLSVVELTNLMIDMFEAGQGNPISIINLAIFMYDHKVNNK